MNLYRFYPVSQYNTIRNPRKDSRFLKKVFSRPQKTAGAPAPASHFVCAYFRTEDTVACVSKSRNDVAMIVEVIIQRTYVDIYIRVCFFALPQVLPELR